MFWSFLSFFFFSPNWNFYQEFTRKFERQYLVLKWDKIQLDIFSMVKKVLERACQLTPPCGIAHSPQSNTTIFNDGSIFFFQQIRCEWNKVLTFTKIFGNTIIFNDGSIYKKNHVLSALSLLIFEIQALWISV